MNLYYNGIVDEVLDFVSRQKLLSYPFYYSDVGIKLLKFGGVQGIARAFETNLEKGIHGKEDDVARRKAEFGSNAFVKLRTRSFFFFSLKAVKDHKILFLLVYAIFSLAFGIKNDGLKEGLSDGGRIFLVISIAATISAAREFCVELMMSNMSSDINVMVMRHGSRQNTSISNVVVGDVVLLQTDDHIPSDGLFLKGDSLQVTYPSKLQNHQHIGYHNPYLLAGGKVTSGSGSMLVTSVGKDTSWGRMMSSAYCDFDFGEKTPLQVRFLKLTWWIRWIVLSISLLILGVMLVRYWMRSQEIDGNLKGKNEVLKSMLRIFTAAITMPVMVFPEGWPIIVILISAYLRRTVMGNHALFRNLSALETMGTVTTICTGKMDMQLDEVKVTDFRIGEEAFTGGSHVMDADQDGAVVVGRKFSFCTDDQRMDMVDQIRVMTSSSRLDKLQMVKCLKQRGQIVANIEDYEDDLLTESHVRLLIITSDPRTVKKNSDIVILNDGFASIEKLLKCGRCIYKNARNFLQFQLTVLIVTLVVNCVTAVSTYKIEISAVQILWESLLLETLGALALVAERPTKELMLKGPVSLEETLITSIMWRNIISQALYQIILLLVLQFKSSSIFHVDGSVSDTLIFNTFVLCQVFNLFNSRNLEKWNMFEGIQDNILFLWIVGMIVSLQVLMVELLYKFACIERLDWRLWAASVGLAAMSWPIALVVRGIPISNATKALQHLCLIFNSFLKCITVGTSRRKVWTHIV